MDVIYGLIPGMILMGLVAVAVFFWAARSGQFDDLEGDAQRILMDEDLEDDKECRAEECDRSPETQNSEGAEGRQTGAPASQTASGETDVNMTRDDSESGSGELAGDRAVDAGGRRRSQE